MRAKRETVNDEGYEKKGGNGKILRGKFNLIFQLHSQSLRELCKFRFYRRVHGMLEFQIDRNFRL